MRVAKLEFSEMGDGVAELGFQTYSWTGYVFSAYHVTQYVGVLFLVWSFYTMMRKYYDIGSGNFTVAKLVRDNCTNELFTVKLNERGHKIDEHVQREIMNHYHKRMATHPPSEVLMVFLTGGSTKLNLRGLVVGLKLPAPEPTT
ncbi:hypothetical protein VNO78_16090 [Psophocarpus tetragonolobus]|uniref:Uncharacterized protein n=1 Tax=Psophocarpus tetragonolobus TaxID=3891 RepID=A0AAN9SHN8_PSOTE